jgi:hypothetical protein
MRVPVSSLPTSIGSILPVVMLLAFGCGRKKEKPEIPATMSYQATLTPINADASAGDIRGQAKITVVGDSLTFALVAKGFEPGSMHLMHIHGFTDSAEASCASAAQDTSGDGYVDLIETRTVSGITMIPFHDNPTSLEIATDTYPTASPDSTLNYQKTVSLSKMKEAIHQKYGIDTWIFEHGVVYIHGVADTMELPASVQSLPDVPAHTTLPVACGKLSAP